MLSPQQVIVLLNSSYSPVTFKLNGKEYIYGMNKKMLDKEIMTACFNVDLYYTDYENKSRNMRLVSTNGKYKFQCNVYNYIRNVHWSSMKLFNDTFIYKYMHHFYNVHTSTDNFMLYVAEIKNLFGIYGTALPYRFIDCEYVEGHDNFEKEHDYYIENKINFLMLGTGNSIFFDETGKFTITTKMKLTKFIKQEIKKFELTREIYELI